MKDIILREKVEHLIYTIRGLKIMLDADLASLYGVSVKRLNEQVKRNIERFPTDFMFQLTKVEAASLRSQIATLKTGRGKHRKYLPYAFSEHGAVMAANVLNSPRAVQMSVFIVRAFVRIRSLMTERHELARKLAELEGKLTKRLDSHEIAIVDVLRRVMRLLEPPPPLPDAPQRRIGFRSRK